MGCSVKSTCETIIAYIDCYVSIIKGETTNIELQLFGENGKPLDLTEYTSIKVTIFNNDYEYGQYIWPENYIESDIVDLKKLNIIQGEDTAGPYDVGVISIDITKDQSLRLLEGPIFAEIHFKTESETTGTTPAYKIISCITLGHIKSSNSTKLNNF